MRSRDDDLDPAEALAEGFGRQVASWAAPDHAAMAGSVARQLSLATSNGHVCITLDELGEAIEPPVPVGELRQRLLASGVVGPDDAPGAMPMVLDTAGRLYLHRLFDFERRLARCVARAATQTPDALDTATTALLASMFDGGAAADGPDWQRVAAALALRQRLVVISGGPGTGKTTTVVSVLAGLLARNPGARIALAAPTGKAAARMTQAIRSRADRVPDGLRERLPGEAFTVHRLLGASPEGFRHHAGNPLPLDALVVDEASMLDLELATRLFEAMPPTGRIVLLGDKDQLAAVEAGAVFAELGADPSLSEACRRDIASAADCSETALAQVTANAMIQDIAVWFRRNYRFDARSGIGRAATAIRDDRADDLLALLRAGDLPDLNWIDIGRPGGSAASVLAAVEEGYAPFVEALRRDPADVSCVNAAFAGFRALCATHEGPQGVRAVNEHVARHVRSALGQPALQPTRWFIGQPLMVLRNDPSLRLFNGDVGIVLPDEDGDPAVMFPSENGGWRAIPPLRLPEHETAFAMTVHKSQGSEFDEALVLLPERATRVATRELLYTAVTRARRKVVLGASIAAVRSAVASPTRRTSGLPDRVREALSLLLKQP